MRIELLPADESLRLQDLYSYGILDSEEEQLFTELLEIITYTCKCPVGIVSFIDKDRQWIKATKGVPALHTERKDSFCAHTILGDDLLVVQDATEDARFCSNPFVTGQPAIRFYAGAPIKSTAGYNLGAVCVIDKQPRKLTETQLNILRVVSKQISQLLDLRLKNIVLKRRSEEYIQLEKKLMNRTLKEQETERSFLSTELHENIAQSMSATKFYLELAESSGEAKDEWIRQSKSMLISIINQVRELSQSIRPTTLKNFHLEEILQILTDHFSRQTGMVTEYYYFGNAPISPESAITIYRIVQEQLRNIKQHAKATKVILNVNACDSLSILIQDDGIGFDLKDFKKGTGINHILLRVENLGGQVDISGHKGKGCQVNITIPIRHKKEKLTRVG